MNECIDFKHFLYLSQGFFVIRLQPSADCIGEIKDPDPLINCDLMDGRDAFLTLARDKHYEFSSLRRAKYSSMGLLYELHVQARDDFIYTCNDCKAKVETRYHCGICDVSELFCLVLPSAIIHLFLRKFISLLIQFIGLKGFSYKLDAI